MGKILGLTIAEWTALYESDPQQFDNTKTVHLRQWVNEQFPTDLKRRQRAHSVLLRLDKQLAKYKDPHFKFIKLQELLLNQVDVFEKFVLADCVTCGGSFNK